jgi:hypothetical protein
MPSHARKPRNYTREDFEGALEAVRAGISIRKASQQFAMPRATLQDRLSNLHSMKKGRPCVLTAEEEKHIVENLKVSVPIYFDTLRCNESYSTKFTLNLFLARKWYQYLHFP